MIKQIADWLDRKPEGELEIKLSTITVSVELNSSPSTGTITFWTIDKKGTLQPQSTFEHTECDEETCRKTMAAWVEKSIQAWKDTQTPQEDPDAQR